MASQQIRRGMVTIVGEPNAGKSTLLNALVGQKLAIVTPKPQTTRTRVLGVAEIPARNKSATESARPAAQVVLLDTPGVLAAETAMDRRMLQEIQDALLGSDAVLLMVDVTKDTPWERESSGKRRTEKGGGGRESAILSVLGKLSGRVLLVLNKIDLVAKPDLLPRMQAWSSRYNFAELQPISARRGDGIEELKDAIIRDLPVGERFFPKDQVTDLPERFIVAELVRERVLMETAQEIPYSTAVIIERFTEPTEEEVRRGSKGGKPPLTRIAAAIICERESQKGILIGKGGAMLKKIGTGARKQIEDLLGTRVMLELFVKVEKDWRDSSRFLDELDWRRQLEDLGSK